LERGFRRQFELIGFRDWTEEEKWGYWATHVNYVRFEYPPNPVYLNLFHLVKDKDYFVMTSNVDGMFYKAGFGENRVYTPQGDYALMQCVKACTQETWSSKPAIQKMFVSIDKDKLAVSDPSLVPYCPNCGSPMFLNVRLDRCFIEKP
jgi:NAD-dependent SIR2 family protein deacetylase